MLSIYKFIENVLTNNWSIHFASSETRFFENLLENVLLNNSKHSQVALDSWKSLSRQRIQSGSPETNVKVANTLVSCTCDSFKTRFRHFSIFTNAQSNIFKVSPSRIEKNSTIYL